MDTDAVRSAKLAETAGPGAFTPAKRFHAKAILEPSVNFNEWLSQALCC